ncbi:NAD(P)-binding protein [Basidiobolus meristosporus CBS 931.73]|uniref:NAD(P)-binding protein n=1 Tax=Basidiobolus meristosporus CBS 931.73 TaxID=1314790 RepID=A0A1Y1VR50_9FUNG|nr:NAD(P)-binding protein [Basidiobolus meristosporus CBS 931.73]|eukprot:ORX63749.1 NAD(P)-binding protein [Basidiobolus meristosporus CBS 931.73]
MKTPPWEVSPYSFGKTLAEKEAWRLVAESRIRLVSINPSCIIGPSVGVHPETESIVHFIDLLEGRYHESGVPSIELCTVDIKDVVEAHIRAFENPNASGRYIVSSEHSTTLLDWAQILGSDPRFATYPLPTKLTGERQKKFHYENRRVQEELGISLAPLEESLKEVAEFLIKSG